MSDTTQKLQQTSPTRSRQFRTIVITVAVLAVLLGGLFAWRMVRTQPAGGWAQPATPVVATVLTAREVPLSLEAVGSLRAVREVQLAPELAGRVANINFASGSNVGAGALLVQLNDAPERAERQAAQARTELTRLQLSRSQELAPLGAESGEILQQRKSERDQATATVRQLDAIIRQKQIRAPFAGQIGIRRVNLGQYLSPGDVIATLTALDTLYVEFSLPQQMSANIAEGATVNVTSDAFPGRTFSARVNAIEPQIAQDTRNVLVQATLPNRGGALRPGMYVTASLVLPPQQNGLVLPVTAIQTSAQGDSVVVIRGKTANTGGKAEIVPVQTGQRIGNSIVITSGLKPGDVVVTEGQLRVAPGAEVKVTKLLKPEGF